MKPVLIVIVSLLAGIATGAGLTWSQYGDMPTRLAPPPVEHAPERAPAGSPHVEVAEQTYDFGPIEHGSTVRHAFVFKNTGDAVLSLEAGQTSCSACTIAELERSEVPPGESTEVVVEYKARGLSQFRQTATVLTNDPLQSRIELTISGKLTHKFNVSPSEIVFGNVPTDKATTAGTRLYQYVPGEFRVVEREITGDGEEGGFSVEVEPLASDDLPDSIVAGYRVLATSKPGLPLGPFRRTIRLVVEFGEDRERSELIVPVEGTVVSDVSVVGRGWHGDRGLLSLGAVPREKGTRRELKLLVRGENRDSVEIEPIEIEPSWLKVTLGERTKLNDSVDQMPLIVEVPPGQSPSIHLGTSQGPLGKIVLGSKNHPYVKELRINVRFVVE